ncbi:unnamed protein product [Durusdinium trenchii]|uniref:Sushi domain-containing protein n=1 Tax=Durusdinium trenchii TaxID=1381693 RepID=A0ABP0HMG9_9DINO
MLCAEGHFTTARCEPLPCGFPIVRGSGDLSICDGYPSGSICELSCASGYVKSGANLRCERGLWSEASCWPWRGCGEPPKIQNARGAQLQDCINLERNDTCPAFHCDLGFQAHGAEALRCLPRGFFSRPLCQPSVCAEAPLDVPHAEKLGSCKGTASGGICRISCEPGYAPVAALHCLTGAFIHTSCEPLSGPLSLALDETMLLAVHLRLPYSSWENLQVNHPKLRSARLARALSKQCGLPSWRLVAKASRPFSMTSTVLDLLLLPANFGAHQYSNMSAAQALQRAKLALKVPEKLLRQVLSFPGGKEIGVERLEVVSRTVGRMCVHPPVVEHAHDLSPCAFTLSGHLCPLVCEAGFVHSGSLACQDGEWLRPHCEEISCDKKPDVENAEDLSHCANSASGSLCGLECQAGYLRTGDLECHRGAWVGGECRPKRCRHVPRVLHADQHALSRCRNLESGSECTLQCEAGFLPTGTGKLQCHLGNFRLQSLCEPAACHQMPKVRNSASNLAECSGLEHSTTCDFKCSDGYQKVGMLQCFHGRFTSARCEPADCKEPPQIEGLSEHEALRCVPRRSGQSCNATCDFPMRMLPKLICSHGKWPDAKCVPYSNPGGEACHKSPVLERAEQLECTHGQHGDVCEASCIRGYALSRPLMCLDSLWSSSSCEPLSCGAPPTIAHSTWPKSSCEGQDHGSFCPLYCDPGYSPGGLPSLLPGSLDPKSLRDQLARRSLRCVAGEWQGPGCLEAACDQPPVIRKATPKSLKACASTRSRSICRRSLCGCCGFVRLCRTTLGCEGGQSFDRREALGFFKRPVDPWEGAADRPLF